MKFLATILLSFFSLLLQAKNIYISATGSDAANGLTQGTAWQTISKLNASWLSVVAAGDSVLFKRGDVFYGSVIVGRSGTSGNPIIIGAYGVGVKPRITGFTDIADNAWTNVGNNIWWASFSTNKTLYLVAKNDIPIGMGRYPNADSANGGYLTYTGFTGNTAIISPSISSVNWVGSWVVIKKEGYIEETAYVTGQSGNTITYVPLPSINPRNGVSPSSVSATPPQAGFGFFFMNSPKTLNQQGEWYRDSAQGRLYMYSVGSPSGINVSSVDTLVNIGNQQYITVTDITFKGSNLAAVYTKDATNITVKNCNVLNSGAKGFFFWFTPNTVFDRDSISNCLCGGIDNTGRAADGQTITNCVVKNTATINGLGNRWDDADMNAIFSTVRYTSLVEGNTVDTCGYNGIQVNGNNITVQKNKVNYYCYIKDDGGGIYTYTGIGAYYINRLFQNNIISNAIGSVYGNAFPTHAEGIYTDGNSTNVRILNNTISNTADRGIYNNDPRNIEVRGNTTFNSGGNYTPNGHNGANAWGSQKHYADSVYGYVVARNVFYSLYSYQRSFNYNNTGLNSTKPPAVSNIQQALQQMGRVDSNVYRIANDSSFIWYYQQVENGNYTFAPGINFNAWKSYTNQDLHSTYPTRIVARDSAILVTNPTDNTVEITLGANYTDVHGNAYNGSITMQPFTGIVLLLAAPTPPTTPTIISFSPTTGYTGLPITINGTNFTGATAVSFGGTPAASFVVNSSISITAYVAAGATGSVSVTTPAGSFSLGGFTYTSAPTPTNCNCMILYNVEILPK
jgi:hypothetical protein